MKTPYSPVVLADRPLRLGKPIVPPVSAEVSCQIRTAQQPISACSLQSLPLNKDKYTEIFSYSSSTKREARALTGYSASIHIVEDVPQTEDPGGSSRCAASEQRGAEFLPRFARVQVRVGFQSRAHAARQRAHLIRSAAAFHLASIALHAHFLARKLQRRVEKRK